jgi:hypothetical protein
LTSYQKTCQIGFTGLILIHIRTITKNGELNSVSSSIQWRRSGRCESGTCVEIARIGESFAVRDSKDLSGPVLTFDPIAWEGFVDGVRAGDFDLR